MNICKADAIAQLSKWYKSATTVQAMYRSITGSILIVGEISELSPSAITIRGDDCEMALYFRDTSEYEYNDARAPRTEVVDQTNKYPIFIDVKFSNNDRLKLSEFSTATAETGETR